MCLKRSQRVKGPDSVGRRAIRRACALGAWVLCIGATQLAVGSSSAATSAGLVATTAKGGGCGVAIAPGSRTLSISVAGRRRTVLVFVPTAYTGTAQLPLVINLHGDSGTALEQAALSGMDTEADEEDFLVAYPQALVAQGSGYEWNIPGVPLQGSAKALQDPPNDLAFLSQLPTILESRFCVDTARVYLTGFSAGAQLAAQLACNDSNIFAAVAPVSGLRWPSSCPAIRPVPVISFHGTADRIDPYDGHGKSDWTYSVPQAAKDWASQDGCRKAVTLVPAAGARLTEYLQCQAKVSVELYSIVGEGHEWPGGPALPSSVTSRLGPQSNALNADGLIWAFFEAHKLP
jgi:polyhydroxybutyrate depolymerase